MSSALTLSSVAGGTKRGSRLRMPDAPKGPVKENITAKGNRTNGLVQLIQLAMPSAIVNRALAARSALTAVVGP